MPMAIHPQIGLADPTYLPHIERIKRGLSERSLNFELGFMTGVVWLITTRGPLKSWMN